MTKVIVAALCLSAIGSAADFWQTKPPESWTESELSKFRTKSPWARKEPQEMPQKERVDPTDGPVIATNRSGKIKTAGKPAKKTIKVWTRVADVQIRWESAPPMLAATARLDPKLRKAFDELTGDFYLVSLTGLLLPQGAELETALDDIRRHSQLQTGDTVIRPQLARVMDAGGGPFYLLQFPRGALDDHTKGVRLAVKVGTMRLLAAFDTKQMSVQGRPAL